MHVKVNDIYLYPKNTVSNVIFASSFHKRVLKEYYNKIKSAQLFGFISRLIKPAGALHG